MKKILLLLLFAGFVAVSAWLIYPFALKSAFSVSGSAEITPELSDRAKRANTMLFVVAKNEGGVPVAVKKIINPVFPQRFHMTPSDLVLPDVLTRRVYLEAYLNSHGELGEFRNGDLKGSAKEPFFIYSSKAHILIDTPAK
ncbi:MAG: hypothetical protein A3J79_11035 [Elusimicrobia bacterium RIFOXYB2_FULL_62_6]|nr:MAG: hypothetical protein A3J79_11035 [Elusimicrobia bacterium RIFOXYB2_FULL_62_6]